MQCCFSSCITSAAPAVAPGLIDDRHHGPCSKVHVLYAVFTSVLGAAVMCRLKLSTRAAGVGIPHRWLAICFPT